MVSVFFYMFALILVLSSIFVILAKNPVHSVFFLILAFFNATGLFVLMGAEFLAMLLLIVYVGAVAVLFLFVVMMLNIDFKSLRTGMMRNASLGILVGVILLAEIIFSIFGMHFGENKKLAVELSVIAPEIENTRLLGRVLYTDYIYLFQTAGLILLVAMVGAIVLTHRKRQNVRKQNVIKQVLRNRNESIKVNDVEIGKGA